VLLLAETAEPPARARDFKKKDENKWSKMKKKTEKSQQFS